MTRRKFLLGVIASAVLVAAAWLAWDWSPREQVRAHQARFLKGVENNDWTAVAALLDPNYAEAWGDDKGILLGRMKEALAYMPGLRITSRIEEIHLEGVMRVSDRIHLEPGLSQASTPAAARVNALQSPFVFHWIKSGGSPWDWTLARIEQPDWPELPAAAEQ